MERVLRGKKILFFYTPFFDYENDIIKGMQEQGAEVWSFNERPSDNVFLRILIRLNKKLIESYFIRYYTKVMKSLAGIHFDYIFVLKAECFTPKVASIVKGYCPDSIFLRYFWDSVENYKDVDSVSHYFNRIFTFDPNDSKKYGYTFLPLFYTKLYEDIAKENSKTEYDLMFAGTVHSDRYAFVQTISSQIKQLGGCCFIWFFLPSKILYYKMKLRDRKMMNTRVSDFNYVPMTRTELMKYYLKSRIVIDIQHPKQTGLTMRTIEALGAHKKIITTNVKVKEYDFYKQSNILVVDRKKPIISADFLKNEWVDVPQDVYEKYSLKSWIKTIFSK